LGKEEKEEEEMKLIEDYIQESISLETQFGPERKR